MKHLLVTAVAVFIVLSSFAQIEYKGSFGKGIRFKTDDGTFSLKVGVRVQPRWDYVYISQPGGDFNSGSFEQQAWVARGRLKFDGYALSPKLVYKIEFDVVGGYVRDAALKYNFNDNTQIWFGQAKLPGNRERVISSGNLQFVNRSITNNAFNIDRDVGIQLHHKFAIGKMVVKDKWALTTGNGIRNKRFKAKPSLTGQIEILPFGEFSGKKGDYISQDFQREQTLKMAFALSVDYNMDSYKTNSHIGGFLDSHRDLLTVNADMFLKYKGISWLTELGQRQVLSSDGGKTSPLVYEDDFGTVSGAYYTGWGLSSQIGYLFKNNWEIAARYSSTRPTELINDFSGEIVTEYNDQSNYSLCLSKYLVGNKLKVQADITYRDLENKLEAQSDYIQGRLQMEIHF